jgi:hypothetical protein
VIIGAIAVISVPTAPWEDTAISPADPCSAWTAKAKKRVQFGYGLNYMTATGHAVIVDVEATSTRTYDEVAATRPMIDRTAYGTG